MANKLKAVTRLEKMITWGSFSLVSVAVRPPSGAAAVLDDELLSALVNNQQLVCNIKTNFLLKSD